MAEILHNIPPVFDEHSEILILGSFPSVRSRETAFFYGHPQTSAMGSGQPLFCFVAEVFSGETVCNPDISPERGHRQGTASHQPKVSRLPHFQYVYPGGGDAEIPHGGNTKE